MTRGNKRRQPGKPRRPKHRPFAVPYPKSESLALPFRALRISLPGAVYWSKKESKAKTCKESERKTHPFVEVVKFRLNAGGAVGELVGDVVDCRERDCDVDVFFVVYNVDLDF